MSGEPENATDLRAAALKGVRWTMIARPLVECVLLGSMVVLSRLISPAEFGHYAVALLISGLGGIPAVAITTALVQRPELDREHLQTGFALALIAAAVIFGLTMLLASTFVVAVFGARTAALVRIAAPLGIITALGTSSTALLQRRLEFRRLSLIDVGSTSVRAIGTVLLALAGLNATALVLGVLGGFAVVSAMSWVWAPPPPPRMHRAARKALLDYAVPSGIAQVSWIGFQNIDYAIVGARLGAVSAGYYFRAYTLGVEYQKKVSQVMVSVGFPVLARTRTDDELGEMRSRMIRLLTVMLFPLLALLAVVAPVAVPWLFGSQWGPAAGPTQWLAIGGAATLVIDAVGATLMAEGRARALLGFGWAHFATYGVAVFLTAPLGLLAVATSAAIVHTAFVFVAYFLLLRGRDAMVPRRIWEDVGPAFVSCAALVAASLPTTIAMSALHAPALPYLAAATLAGAITYVAVLRTCFPATWASFLSLVRHLLPRRAAKTAPPSSGSPSPQPAVS